ncbi:hypothetical protein B0J12DRAFT_77322 [Macrophomina phaseolina]|nr:hypothetical protein B0J12DRAFT_77322 [Macrophomina phaseolina]
MGQDEIHLQVLAVSGDVAERKNAARVLSLLQRGKHWVLVTLLLSNVITNETLPIVLDRSLGGGMAAVVSSTVLIVIFGEILPQSVCVRYGLPIGAWMSPIVLALMWALCPVAFPIAKLLDHLLGADPGTVYKRAGLKALVTLHKTLGLAEERLNQDEVTIIGAVLDLKDKPVGSIMTPVSDVFTMSADTVLDEETVSNILSAGYSRIPIHNPDNSRDFVGMLLVKLLITYDPEDCKRVCDFTLATLPETRAETSCLDIINFFQEGKSHMVLISNFPGEPFGALGVVTLEDVVEELIGEEIIDESDVRRSSSNWRKCLPAMTPPSHELDDSDFERKREPRLKFGPSNAASNPKSTRISTVKIKRSTGSMLDAAATSNARGYGTASVGGGVRQKPSPIPIRHPQVLEKAVARSGSLSESVREVAGVRKVVLDILNG